MDFNKLIKQPYKESLIMFAHGIDYGSIVENFFAIELKGDKVLKTTLSSKIECQRFLATKGYCQDYIIFERLNKNEVLITVCEKKNLTTLISTKERTKVNFHQNFNNYTNPVSTSDVSKAISQLQKLKAG